MDLRTFHYIIISVATLLIGAACGRGTSDNPALIHASHLLENEPDSISEAKQMLDSMSSSSLNEGDRSLHALLSVKANDKLYIPHTSDSLILLSLKYEEKHPKRGFYPEALYYAGRVYSDLGDYPTALNFFNHATHMDDMPLPLRSRILSQTGRLYNDVHLYSDAARSLIKAIRINETLSDTANLSFDNQLIGAIYMHQGKLDSADIHINRGYRLADHLPSEHRAFMTLYKAIIKEKLGQSDSAVIYINQGALDVWDDTKPFAYISAADIYYKAGMYEEAYALASQVVDSDEPSAKLYRSGAFTLFLRPELRKFSEQDLIGVYIDSLLSTIAIEQKRTEANDVSIVKNTLNYESHVKAKEKAEIKQQDLEKRVLWVSIGGLLIAFGWALTYIQRNRKYASLLEKYTSLTQLLKKLEHENPLSSEGQSVANLGLSSKTEDIKRRIKDIIKVVTASKDSIQPIDETIVSSEAFVKLQQHIVYGKAIPESATLWDELEKAVRKSSPHFVNNLRLLLGKFSVLEFKLLLLIKCGVKPGEAAEVLNKSKQTVSGYRTKLRKRLAGDGVSTEYLDAIIRKL
ncbi:MAG: tetratricopeptide repeat protein [Muribaculaceae bacterium]|nr:tetratricopeptide repeat protein [Muribaculaceae bacterium]